MSSPSPSLTEPADLLSDADYHACATAALNHIEQTIDRWLDADVVDIDTHRTGGLLELALPNGSKIILNLQPPLQEVWMAAQAGGFHYRSAGGVWLDTRTGEEFFAALSKQLTRQAGVVLEISAP